MALNTTKICQTRRLAALLGGVFLVGSGLALAAEGVVTQRAEGCSYFIAQVDGNSALLERNGGYEPQQDDVVEGRFTQGSMGFLKRAATGAKIKVWYEKYPVSKEEALQSYNRVCER